VVGFTAFGGVDEFSANPVGLRAGVTYVDLMERNFDVLKEALNS